MFSYITLYYYWNKMLLNTYFIYILLPLMSFVFFFVTQVSRSGVHSSPLSLLLLLQLLYRLLLLFLTLLFFCDLTSKPTHNLYDFLFTMQYSILPKVFLGSIFFSSLLISYSHNCSVTCAILNTSD